MRDGGIRARPFDLGEADRRAVRGVDRYALECVVVVGQRGAPHLALSRVSARTVDDVAEIRGEDGAGADAHGDLRVARHAAALAQVGGPFDERSRAVR